MTGFSQPSRVVVIAAALVTTCIGVFAQDTAPEVGTDFQPSIIDFSFDRGSLILKQRMDNGLQRTIRIVGPQNPNSTDGGEIEISVEPGGIEFSSARFPDILSIVKERIKSGVPVSTEESSFLAAALLQSQNDVKIQHWGVGGWNLLRKGKWVDLFQSRPGK